MSAEGPDLRISNAEREDALRALEEHVGTGRLDIDEFGDRSAQISAARLRSQLVPLFADLPEPRPAVLKTTPAAPTPSPIPPAGAHVPRFASGAVPLAVLVGLVLVVVLHLPFFLMLVLPVATALAMGAQVNRRRRHGPN